MELSFTNAGLINNSVCTRKEIWSYGVATTKNVNEGCLKKQFIKLASHYWRESTIIIVKRPWN